MKKAFVLDEKLLASLAAGSLLNGASVVIEEGIRVIRWTSANPSVEEPLTLRLCEIPGFYWFTGYLCDFPAGTWGENEQVVEQIVSFVKDFMRDKIVCTVAINESGRRMRGGPVLADSPHLECWRSDENGYIRSWTGALDKDGRYPFRTEKPFDS